MSNCSFFSPDRLLRYALPLLVAVALTACEKPAPDPTLRISGSTMGTSYDLQLVPTPGQTLPLDLKTRVDELLARVNKQMSTYDPDSELSRFNRNASTDWIAVSPELQAVVAEGLRVSELSGGAFDITVGPLVNLWGFGPEPRRDQVPSDAAIAQARERVGYWRLQSREEPPALKKDRADLYVDLSALAKGYGVDQLAALMEANGVANYLVSISGDIRAKGRNGKGQPWTVAIEQPTPGQRAVKRLIRLGDHGVSTAGDYRNFFEQNGQRYSHIINPRTGRPVPQTLVSVTVISDSDMAADAADTALMAAGPDFGFQLATDHHLAAFFIIISPDGKSFQERYTPEFEPYLLPSQP
ncbi:MAG: FAD:protein FMN transferase [Candidatus Competibacter sp.]|nr:FAD:protein FMN transferase [Candidatus Competibacter sp.]HRD50697.1 FAD:protein FMN transferase [Candidatus Contendobacter sp.]